jgi:putative DNA primase/helicase
VAAVFNLDESLKETPVYQEALKEQLNGTARPRMYNLTDLGNAERLVARYGDILRYCNPWGKWLVWDGKRWEIDQEQIVKKLARETVRAIYNEAAQAPESERKAIAKHAISSEAEARLNAMTNLAQMDVPILPEQLDTHRWLLNCQNGTLDLRIGQIRPHRREDFITKVTPSGYDRKATCPTWRAFLKTAMGGSQALQDFLQRAIGRTLTGDVSEKILHVLWGGGDNGKTTFLEMIHAMVGEDYGVRTPTETLLARNDNAIPNDVAQLKGARFVYASEAEEGKRLAEARIKDMTGGDTVSARFMRGEWFSFRPEFKLWLGTNHKPVIRGTDKAIWNRVKLIPFTVTIPPHQQDKKLPEKLRAELPGLLTWAVEGCLLWQRDGLGVPEEIESATKEYRSEMDVLGAFIEECCVLRAGITTPASSLFGAYSQWCEQSGEKAITQTAFAARLKERGLENDRSTVTGRKIWKGVGVRIVESDNEA